MKLNKANSLYVILSWPFMLALFALLVNDIYLKYSYPSWFTGKLSDFAGIFVVSFLLYRAFPKRIYLISIIVGLLFIYWKSPYSQHFIETMRSTTFLNFNRVVDYTDILALLILPLSAKASRFKYKLPTSESVVSCSRVAAIFAITFAITGTSVVPLREHYELQKTDNSEKIELNKAIIIIKTVAENNGLECETCELDENAGTYTKSNVRFEYVISEDRRTINFHLVDRTGPFYLWPIGGLFKLDSEKLKKELRSKLSQQFSNLEFTNFPPESRKND